MAALAAAAQRGVLIKGGSALESLAKVQSIAFDKTGTLSQGVFELLHFYSISQTRSRREVLGYLALMEKSASHPVSDAIVIGAANEQVDIPNLAIVNHTLLPGEGVTASIESNEVFVGNKRLFQRLGLFERLPHDVIKTSEHWTKSGATVGFISIGEEGIVGTYVVADKIRDEALEVVEALRRMNIETTMLTGDQWPAAMKIGGQLGLQEKDIKSDLLPKDKRAEIIDKVNEVSLETKQRCWSKKRTVVMVGDGVNDAFALSAAGMCSKVFIFYHIHP